MQSDNASFVVAQAFARATGEEQTVKTSQGTYRVLPDGSVVPTKGSPPYLTERTLLQRLIAEGKLAGADLEDAQRVLAA